MPYDKNIHHRRTIRLHDYDYSGDGMYFITICTQDKKCIFGRIKDGEMILNDWGRIVDECLSDIPKHYPNASVDEYIVMPNHIHFMLIINKNSNDVGAQYFAPNQIAGVARDGVENIRPLRPVCKSGVLGSIIRGFKIGVTKKIGRPVLQRNYYEHIIRDADDYEQIRNYINGNPQTWDADKLYQKQLDEFNKEKIPLGREG